LTALTALPPAAIAWASPRVRERARARHVDIGFTRDLGATPPEEWQREIDQTLFPGGYFKEFIFFHKASKTLILTDTIINIELGSRLIKSTIQEQRRGRQRPGNFARAYRTGLRCAGNLLDLSNG
jgi:hypothetical protein